MYQAFITAADSFGAQVEANGGYRKQTQVLEADVKDAGQIAGDRLQSRSDLMDQQHAERKAEFESKERALAKENGGCNWTGHKTGSGFSDLAPSVLFRWEAPP